MSTVYASKKRRARHSPVIRPASELSKPELMWVVSSYNNMLHCPALNEYETEMLSRKGMYFGGDILCGRDIDELNLPGPKTAKIAQRCARCCKEVGYPTGIGSPIHDAEIRILIGLDKAPVPVEWEAVAQRLEDIRLLCEEWRIPGLALVDDYREGRADMAQAVLRVLDGVADEELAAS